MYTAQKQYQALSVASRIEAADPHELVAILYEELIRSLDVIRAALNHGKADALRSGRQRASSILVALDASLDLNRGGELARNLAQIYRSMQKEIGTAGDAGRADRLEAVRAGVAELLGAWSRIGLRRAA